MKPFKNAIVTKEEQELQINSHIEAWRKGDPVLRQATNGLPEEGVIAYIRQLVMDSSHRKIVVNDVYKVTIYDDGPMVHLSICRLDRHSCHDWRDFQEIKNMLVGPECEGVELYPAESRLVDTANQYHLWCMRQPGVRLPFGFSERLVGETEVGRSKQRPFKKNGSH